MKLKLTHFKCHTDSEFEFLDGKVTLIKGHSGVGKTTLFVAIDWLLYGKRRNIEPIAPPGGNSSHSKNALVTSVMLELPGVAIYRQRNPRLLQFRVNETIYTDDDAQALIIKYFGDQDAWTSSSALWQGDRNSFLSSSNPEKMALLRKLVFGNSCGNEDGPATSYVQTLANAQQRLQEEQLIFSSRCTEMQNNYQQRSIGIEWSMAKNDIELEALRQEVAASKLRLAELLKVQQQRQIDLGVIDSMESQLKILKNQLQQLVANDNRNEDLMRDIKLIELYQSAALDKVSWLIRERDRLPTIAKSLSPVPDLSTNEYELRSMLKETENQERAHGQGTHVAYQLGIAYREEARKEAICDIRRQLSDVPLFKLYEQIRSLKTNVEHGSVQLKKQERDIEYLTDGLVKSQGSAPSELIIPPLVLPSQLTEDNVAQLFPAPQKPEFDPSPIVDRIRVIELEIYELSRAHNAIECPSCQASLFYENGKLTQSVAIDNRKNVDELRNEHAQLSTILQNGRAALQRYQYDTENVNRQRQAALHQNKSDIDVTRVKYNSMVEMLKRDHQYKLSAWENAKQQTERLLESQRSMLEQSRKHLTETTAQLDALLQQLRDMYNMNLDDLVEAMNTKVNQSKDVASLEYRLMKLESLQIVEVPLIGSDIIKKQLQYVEAKTKYDDIEIMCRDIPEVYDGWTTVRLATATAEMRRHMQLDVQRNQLTTTIEQLEKTITDKRILVPTDPASEITSMQQGLQRNEYFINYAIHVNGLLAEFQYIQSQMQILSGYNARLAAMQRMRVIALERESSILQQRIDSINYNLARITAKLFDTPIAIRLQLYKEIKTHGLMRPCVNFNIVYQGGEFDNINQLSGGEGDRISLALTLALALMSKSPIILLDECFAALNNELKCRGIRTISKLAKCKTVLVICHESVEGFFDAVVQIGGETSYIPTNQAILTF